MRVASFAMDKTVVMIGGGEQEVEAVKQAQSWGYNVIVTDKNANAPAFLHADELIVCDGRDVERLIGYLSEHKFHGIFTLTEMTTTVALLSEYFGLRGCNPRAAMICQNKWVFKKEIGKPNPFSVPTPEGRLITTYEDFEEFIGQFGRCYIKPAVGFGNKAGWEENRASRLRFDVCGGNEQYVIEEYIEGIHYDAHALVYNADTMSELGVTRRKYRDDGTYDITVPEMRKKKAWIKDSMYQILRRVSQLTGLVGPIKGDFIYNPNYGVYLLEVASRLHGPRMTLVAQPEADQWPLKTYLEWLTRRILFANCLSMYG